MPNQYLELVIDFEGELIAFGHEINNCSDVGPGMIWRSSDGGTTWQHAVTLSAAGPGHWMDTTTTGGRVLATTAGTSGVRVWLSDDGLEWRGPSGNGPARRYLGGLNEVVVSSNATYEEEVTVMTSSDRGESWEEVALELRGEFRPSFAANNGLLVGVFSEFERAWPMTTQDGLTWTVAEEPLQTDVDKVVAVPGGFLSLSNRGSTYLSADGLDWFAGPPQRMLTDDRGIRGAVADGVGVLLFTMDFRNARQYDEHLWFAPIGAFDPFWSTD
ncbi:MAG TPA: hypothetical protein VMZ33_06795 [Candidatus Limnocylindrales bacterium]|nr:hypothetical protein [Candidatus Limnocylindrales bacterium]